MRNFENLSQGLHEMQRVLRPGGRIVVLEFSRPAAFPFRQLYLFYFRRILPMLGRAISKDRTAYEYLPHTVMEFPEGEEFLAILREAGIRSPRQKRLTLVLPVFTQENDSPPDRIIRVVPVRLTMHSCSGFPAASETQGSPSASP
jgi:ubiquinone/menaquinone biosynthesis C-methylase UbiE